MANSVVAFSFNNPQDRLHPQVDQVKHWYPNVIAATSSL
jgi:hypothetical protein